MSLYASRFNSDGLARRPGLLRLIHLDLPLLLGIAVLAVVSMVALYSAGGQDGDLLVRQGIRLAIAFGFLLVAAQIPPEVLRRHAPWLFLVGLGLLLAVMVLGEIGKGARRWLDLGFVRFQPSELMKLLLPMMVAWLVTQRPLPPNLWRIGLGLILIVVPTALVARQPDLGTALLLFCSGLFVLFLAGMRWWMITSLLAAAAAAAPVAWTFFLHDYQRQRILTMFNPESDRLGAGYHIIQSKIAVGSGGLYGKGWLNGTQSQLEFLPERSTDFIFAVLAEEFGFAGMLALLVLYLLIVARGLYIAMNAQTTFGCLLAGSLTLTFFIYVLVNVGMVIGLLPVVGLPLPLVSYGGTSMVTMMAAFGILMSIHTHRKLLEPH